MKTERELFEDWCHINDEFCTHRYTDNCQEYSDDYTQSAWLAWQARVPEGYVVVPVELADEIEDKIWDNLSANHTITNQEGDGFIPVEDIDLGGIYKAMIEAA